MALVLLVVAVVLTGCDAFYDLTIENNRNQEVVVRVTGLGDFRMSPCSVQINSTVSSPLRGSIQVEAQDTVGNQIYKASIKPEKKSEGMLDVYVRIPPEGPGACPAPVRGTFMLIVKNYLRQDASVWLDNVELGSVQALSTQTFGPLPGTWETKKKIKFLDSEGKPLLWAIDVDYNLGQVPQFFAYITPQ